MLENKARFNVSGIVAACLVVILQIVLAPAMTIGAAVPNFIAAYVICAALCRSFAHPAVLAFVMGLIFDLIGSGPVGAMAFCLTLVATIASLIFANMNNSSWITAIVFIALSCLLIEFLYGAIMLLTGMADGFGSALVTRILPCTLYDFVIGAIMYPIVARLLGHAESSKPSSLPIIR